MKGKLPPIASKILTVMIQQDEYLTTAQIAKEAEISWNTALLYLNGFEKKGWVDKIMRGSTVYWKAIVEDY